MPHPLTTLSFPDLRLPRSAGHLLRGYFGNAFREHSPLLHNHLEDGSYRNGYPLVQYKMVDGTPTVIGIGAGSEVILKVFGEVESIRIADQTLDARTKELTYDRIEPRVHADRLFDYRLETPYRAFNQDQYPRWRAAATDAERFALTVQALTGHLLMIFKGLDVWVEKRIVAYPFFEPLTVGMKGQRLTAFRGHFVSNVELPDLIGVGKGTSRGFGTLQRVVGRIAPLSPPQPAPALAPKTTTKHDH